MKNDRLRQFATQYIGVVAFGFSLTSPFTWAASDDPGFSAQGSPYAERMVDPAVAVERPQSTSFQSITSGVTRRSDVAQSKRIELGFLTQEERQEIRNAKEKRDGPRQIGIPRRLSNNARPSDFLRGLDWQATFDGGFVTSINVDSPEAIGIRMGLIFERMPSNTVIRFIGNEGQSYQVSYATIESMLLQRKALRDDSGDSETYWSPTIHGSTAAIEVEITRNASIDDVIFDVPRLSHHFASMNDVQSAPYTSIGTSASCNNDLTCNPSYAAEAGAVGQMSYVSGGGSYICTGTLMNDWDSSTWVPYFLTANHCISTQTEADSLETHWNWQSATCGSTTVSSSLQSLFSGAKLLYASADTDTSFLALKQTPPGANFAGWYVGTPPSSGTPLFGIHHPHGDLKKISAGTLAGLYDCISVGFGFSCGLNNFGGEFIGVSWTNGITEGGSSGSGLWANVSGTNYLIGQLKGGSSSCPSSGVDYYGRLDIAYNASISTWLNATTAPFPDLKATLITTDSTGLPGGAFRVAVSLTNQGATASSDSRTRFYLSTNSPISTGDLDINYGCDHPSIAPGATSLCAGVIQLPVSISAGQSYYFGAIVDGNFAVFESDEYNNSLATSGVVTIVGAATVPGAPTIGTATAGNGQATVTFTAPASTGGSAITSYTATSSPDGLTGTCFSSPCTVTGLANLTTYTFTVAATNIAGTGPSSGQSNTTSLPQLVLPAITLGSTANPSTIGQYVTYTAVVAGSSGTPTGTIIFRDNGIVINGCGGLVMSNRRASCTIGNQAQGTHSMTAVYSGNQTYSSITSSTLPQVVNAAKSYTPSITLGSSVNPSTESQYVELTAVVSGGAGTPTGTLVFLNNGDTISGCGGLPMVNGIASCTPGNLTLGTHSIRTVYSGDATYNGVTSSTLPQTVGAARANTPSFTLGSSQNPSIVGNVVTFTAVLSGGAGTPTGNVIFRDNGLTISGCGGLALTNGRVSCSPRLNTAGTHSITGIYLGDPNYNGRTSSVLPQVMQ